jgi:hypothetical protein
MRLRGESAAYRGPRCIRCDPGEMRLAHVEPMVIFNLRYEVRTYKCLTCGHMQTYTFGSSSVTTSRSYLRRHSQDSG